MRPLHHPAPCPGPGVPLGPCFLATAAQMQGKAKFFRQGARLGIIKAFVETEMLRPAPRWLGPLNGYGLKRLAHQLVVVAIGSVDHRPEWDAAAVAQQ